MSLSTHERSTRQEQSIPVCTCMKYDQYVCKACTPPEISTTTHLATINQSSDDGSECQLSKTDLYGEDGNACIRSNASPHEDSEIFPPFISTQFEKLNTVIDKLESVGKTSGKIQQKLNNKESALREKISAAKCNVVSQLDDLESNMQLGENNKQAFEKLRQKLKDS